MRSDMKAEGRPVVLIVEPDDGRRRNLGLGLAVEGYEVVLAANEEQGRRFAFGLAPAVIVAPVGMRLLGELAGVAKAAGQDVAMPPTLARRNRRLRQVDNGMNWV